MFFKHFSGSLYCCFVYCVCLSVCLVCDSSIVATCPSTPAVRFAFRLCFICFVLFVVVLSGELKQNQGRVLVDRKLVQPPPPFPSNLPSPFPSNLPPSPVMLLLAILRRLFCFGPLVILDVVFRYLSLFLL